MQGQDISPATAPYALSGLDQWSFDTVFDHLVMYQKPSGEIWQQLAQSQEFNADQSQLTFHLRRNVKFHDGSAFTSQAIKFNLEHDFDPATKSQIFLLKDWISSIETPDDSTVVLKFTGPRPTVLDFFNYFYVVEPNSIQNGQSAQGNFVGTGPFKWQQWVPGDHFTMVRNTDYWTTVNLDSIRVNITPDTQTQYINLQNGAGDVAWGLTAQDAVQLKSNSSVQLIANNLGIGLGGGCWFLGLSVLPDQPYSDKRVRQAMAWLIDREKIVKDVLSGFGVATNLLSRPGQQGYFEDQDKTYTYKPDKATQLLQQAGLQLDGAITLDPTDYPLTPGMSDIIAGGAASIGQKLSSSVLARGPFVTQRSKQPLPAYISVATGALHAITLLLLPLNSKVPGNPMGYDSPEMEALETKLTAATDLTEPQGLAKQCNQLMLDECWLIPMVSANNPYGVSKKVNLANYDGYPRMADISLA